MNFEIIKKKLNDSIFYNTYQKIYSFSLLIEYSFLLKCQEVEVVVVEEVGEVEVDHHQGDLHQELLQVEVMEHHQEELDLHLEVELLLDLIQHTQLQVLRILIRLTIFRTKASSVPVAKQPASKPSTTTSNDNHHVVEMRGPGLGQTIVGSAASGLGLGMGLAAGQAYYLYKFIFLEQ